MTELFDDSALSARSVLASALLGADEPHLSVRELVAFASLFGISDGATRTCLWRMASNGELTADNGNYALTGRLAERRQRVDEASRIGDASAQEWDRTWELAVVSVDRRPAADRLELRKAAAALHLAELREGVWIRPDNLNPRRLPMSRAVLDEQCTHFHHATTDIAADTMRSVFSLDDWAHTSRQFIAAMDDRHGDGSEGLRHQFALSVAVVRHLQLDPVLPPPLLPADWPGGELRGAYRRFDKAFKRNMDKAFRRAPR